MPAPAPAPDPEPIASLRPELLAGNPQGYGFVDGLGTAARFGGGAGLSWARNGDILVADGLNNAVRRVTPGGQVSTVAGSGPVAGDCCKTNFADGPAAQAKFSVPSSAVEDDAGNVFVADDYNHLIRKIDPSGTVSTVAGQVGVCGTQDGQGSAATLCHPRSMVIDKAGNLYVSESVIGEGLAFSNPIRKIAPNGTVTTLVKQTSQYSQGWDGFSNSPVYREVLLAIDSNGTLFAADDNDNVIRKILPDGTNTVVSGTLIGASVGTGANNRGSVDGPADVAKFSSLTAIAFDTLNRLYVVDHGTRDPALSYLSEDGTHIRYVSPSGTVTTVVTQDGCQKANEEISLCNAWTGMLIDPKGSFVTSEWVRKYVQDGANVEVRYFSSILRKYTPGP